MRDFYEEFLEREKISGHAREQLPKLPKGLENIMSGSCGSNGSSFDDRSADEINVVQIVKTFSDSQNGPSRIYHYNAIDAYQAKLTQVRSNPELAALVETLFEERKAMMLGSGSSEEESEAYISSMEFLVSVLKSV